MRINQSHTEDYASILLHYENGVRGVLTVSQVSSGRKNRLFFEINGSKSSLFWNCERPNELWIGHRSEPNQSLDERPIFAISRSREQFLIPAGTTKVSRIHSSSFITRFTITSWQEILLLARIFPHLPMDTTNRCCVKQLNAVPKRSMG